MQKYEQVPKSEDATKEKELSKDQLICTCVIITILVIFTAIFYTLVGINLSNTNSQEVFDVCGGVLWRIVLIHVCVFAAMTLTVVPFRQLNSLFIIIGIIAAGITVQTQPGGKSIPAALGSTNCTDILQSRAVAMPLQHWLTFCYVLDCVLIPLFGCAAII